MDEQGGRERRPPALAVGDRILIVAPGHPFRGTQGKVEEVTSHGRLMVRLPGVLLQVNAEDVVRLDEA